MELTSAVPDLTDSVSSFQLTAQEISTVIRLGLKPIV